MLLKDWKKDFVRTTVLFGDDDQIILITVNGVNELLEIMWKSTCLPPIKMAKTSYKTVGFFAKTFRGRHCDHITGKIKVF